MTLPLEHTPPASSTPIKSGPEIAGKAISASKRFVFQPWGGGAVHELCDLAAVKLPERTPVAARTGIATANWVVVDRQESRELICNLLHTGSCVWPWSTEAS